MANLTTSGTYFPSYSNAGAGIAGSKLGANAFKTAARTQFGTRELSVIKVLVGGTNASMILVDGSTGDSGGVVGHTMSNSLFSVAVRNLQQFAEVYAVYTPVATGFIAIIATDTANSSESGNGTNPIATTFGLAEASIKAAIQAINAQTDATVTISLPTVAIGTTL
jgi:hypothetical protein